MQSQTPCSIFLKFVLNVDVLCTFIRQLAKRLQRNLLIFLFSGFFSSQIINSDIDETETFSVLAFDSSSITDLLHEFSNTSATKVALGYVLMVGDFVSKEAFCCEIINHKVDKVN